MLSGADYEAAYAERWPTFLAAFHEAYPSVRELRRRRRRKTTDDLSNARESTAEAVETGGTIMIGRPYSPTDISHPLIPFLGYPVSTEDGIEGFLADVTADGMASLSDERDMCVAVVPAETVHLALSRMWSS